MKKAPTSKAAATKPSTSSSTPTGTVRHCVTLKAALSDGVEAWMAARGRSNFSDVVGEALALLVNFSAAK